MIIPKKNQSWLQRNVWYVVASLVGVAVWWWFEGEHMVFGDLSNRLTPPRHLK